MLPWLSKRQTSKKASVIAEQKCEKFFKGKLKNRSKHTNHEKGAREHINYLLQVNPPQTRGEGRKGEGVGGPYHSVSLRFRGEHVVAIKTQ